MPQYDYTCKGCKKDFVVEMRISELDIKKITCPGCASTNVGRNVTNASFWSESVNRYVWNSDKSD